VFTPDPVPRGGVNATLFIFIYIIKSYAKYTVNDKKKEKKTKIKKNSTQFT